MCNTAAHLVDRVLPEAPLRQWVLSVPFEMRLLLASRADALNALNRILRSDRQPARLHGVREARGGPPEPPGQTSGGSIGAGAEPSCFFDANLRYDPCGLVFQLQSADGNICLRIDRRNDGPGNDANTSWTLLDVRVGPLGQVCHTDDPAALCLAARACKPRRPRARPR